MENMAGQWTHSTKMGADKLAENAPNTPKFLAQKSGISMKEASDVVLLLWVNDDTKVFEQHHAVLKTNNRLHWPGAS